MKIIYLILFVVFLNHFGIEKSFSQDKEDLKIRISPEKISGDNFDGKLSLSIENISKDTLYILIEPFLYGIKSDTIVWYFMGKYHRYAPNEICFVRQSASIDFRDAGSKVSLMRFPRILYLFPQKQTTFHLNAINEILNDMKGDIWDILCEICYAYKSDVDNILKWKPDFINLEFKNSLFYMKNVNINPGYVKTYEDSTLFILQDGKNIKFDYESKYDSVIFKSFIQRFCNFLE